MQSGHHACPPTGPQLPLSHPSAPPPRCLPQPARPKLELELPYRQYRLVRADGGAAERPDKHPFSLSRVYYDASEKPEEVGADWGVLLVLLVCFGCVPAAHRGAMRPLLCQARRLTGPLLPPLPPLSPYHPSPPPPQVWAELGDGSCRWRQTGGEVKVLALRVPAELPTKQLAVDIQPYSLKGGRL